MIEQILQADRLLTVDRVEQARDMYARIAELDPGNAIAVVGLARCALADGDDRAAHELAARALRLDPENDMARRMEARLAEILATRGDPVARPVEAGGGTSGLRPIVAGDDHAADPNVALPVGATPGASAGLGMAAVPSTAAQAAGTAIDPGITLQDTRPAVQAAGSAAPSHRSFLDRLRGRA